MVPFLRRRKKPETTPSPQETPKELPQNTTQLKKLTVYPLIVNLPTSTLTEIEALAEKLKYPQDTSLILSAVIIDAVRFFYLNTLQAEQGQLPEAPPIQEAPKEAPKKEPDEKEEPIWSK